MRIYIAIILLLVFVGSALAQSDIQKLIDTENAFAALAAEKGTRAAFIANAAPDGLIFQPDRVNAIQFWTAREPSPSLLSWAPNYGDVSANGILGYTTGNWEYRVKGKDDQPSYFGEFITVWVRQPDGKYKFALDIGIEHPKPPMYSSEWVTSPDSSRDANPTNSSAAHIANGFIVGLKGGNMRRAYESYLAADVRAFREGQMPINGKKAVIAALKTEKGSIVSPKQRTFFGSAGLAYSLTTYTRSVKGSVVERGNMMQIWKLIGGKWLIVLDVIKPVPPAE